jgi:phosphatidyl-myo-inositol alpha-mannosyltransferase
MRIAIVTDFYYPALGGISEHVDGQARSLTELGHEVTVITGNHIIEPRTKDDDLPPPAPTFEVLRMGTIIPIYVPKFGNNAQTQHIIGPWIGKRLGTLFRERGFDVVHVHAPYNPPMPAWAIQHTPYDALSVATFHSVFPATVAMDIQAAWIRPLIERLDGRICVSEACIGSLTPYFPFTYHVIPNGIDADLFSPDAEPVAELMGSDHQNITFIGRFDPRNGLDTMIAAFRMLVAERGSSVRLIVVGDGPLRSVYERQAHEVRDQVHWAGRLNRSRPNHITSGDVFCTPCNRASFGMVLLEAMSCGRPVVASRISGFQLVMRDGVHGAMIDPADSAEKFAAALGRMLDSPEDRHRMGAAGRREALERYSWPRVGAQLETYYTDLIAGRQPTWANAKH